MEHGAVEIPVKLVTYQTINFVIMVAGLVYFLKDGVKKFFLEKKANYLNAAQKADAARKAAEDERMEIQAKLSKLESAADENLARARAEAMEMKKQLIAEADNMSRRIRDEAAHAAKFESERAKAQLREALIQESLEIARGQLSSKVTSDDHQRLQSEFLNNIQVVQK